MLDINMTKIAILLMFATIIFTGCVNKHGLSAKYYSDCKEYYDLQGYYHNECGKDDVITYKGIARNVKSVKKTLYWWKKEKKQGNVW